MNVLLNLDYFIGKYSLFPIKTSIGRKYGVVF